MKCYSLLIVRGTKSQTIASPFYLSLDNAGSAMAFEIPSDTAMSAISSARVEFIGPAVMKLVGYEAVGTTRTGAKTFQHVEWFVRHTDSD